jgi:hypothetical protein
MVKISSIKKELLVVVVAIVFLIVIVVFKKADQVHESADVNAEIPTKQEAPLPSDPNSVTVTLNTENNFTDKLEKGSFTRSADEGPGTGMFVSEGFEFTQGNCAEIIDRGPNNFTWTAGLLSGCSKNTLLKSDWCGRLIDDRSVMYTLRFLSWASAGDQACLGECAKYNNQTAYLRTNNSKR